MNNTNYSRVAVDISEYTLPVSSVELFQNTHPTALEIGFGEGEFITELALGKPEWNFIGLEVKYFRFRKAVRSAERKMISNLKLIHIDARIAVQQVFSPEQFDFVYLNFPDPWPKDKHIKHRIINSIFVNDISRIMKPGSKIEFVTDSLDYMAHAEDYFLKSPDFTRSEIQSDFFYKRPQTRFYNEFTEQERKIYIMRYIKINKHM